eukprot:s1750_g13.t1
MPFAAWAQDVPELGPLPQRIPHCDLIHCIYQLFKFHVDQRVAEDGKLRYQHAKWAMFADKKYGHSKQAFATARGKFAAPLHRIVATHDETAICMTNASDLDGTVAELAVEDPMKFHMHFPVQILGKNWWIQNLTSYSLVVHSPIQQDLADEVHISQVIEHFDKDAIFHQLNLFWGKYWQRDDPVDVVSDADQQAFQEVLAALPPDLQSIQVEQHDLQLWLHAIQTTKAQSAPGVDGVRAAELQLLPNDAIRTLIEVVTQEPGIMTPDLMQGRTIPIPKVQDMCQVSQIRPITILPQIYRIWAKMVTSQILASLSSQLPPQITGFLKNRSAARAAYDMQFWLESHANDASPRGGA